MIAITGAPNSGKTTFASKKPGVVRCTDEVMGAGWSEASAIVAQWFDDPAIDVVEGVAVPRALRKWLLTHRVGRPVETLIVLRVPALARTASPGQARMAAGMVKVLAQIEPELLHRGVQIKRFTR